MAEDRVPPANLRAEIPENTLAVRALRPAEIPQTLAASLVPVADSIRQLYTDFGIRPYRVFLVHVFWTGGRKGSGQPMQTAERELLPTPRVRDMNATSEVLRATGLSEEGSVSIDQISTKYAEDDLMGRTPDLQDLATPRTSAQTSEFFWEVRENRTNQPKPFRRRYVPNAAPMLSRDGFQWSLSFTRQDAERSRNGLESPRSAF